MGRHRRSGAAPAGEAYAAGTDRRQRGARRRRRGAPVRTGLLGASAAVAVGAAVAASGLLPGGQTFTLGTAGSSERPPAETRQAPELTTQGGATRTPAAPSAGSGTGTGTGTGAAKNRTASASPSAKPTPERTPAPATSRTKAPKPATAPPKPTAARTTAPAAPKPTPTPEPPAEETTTTVTSTADRADAVEAEVVRLVNVERGRVGCSPIRQDEGLAKLAGAFSADMADRGFFDHTDPDGLTPWARAEKAGVTGLGGENIARGQVDAAAVMASWMNSDGHRANILNCDFTALGVGVHFGDGGPWWTQDFGY